MRPYIRDGDIETRLRDVDDALQGRDRNIFPTLRVQSTRQELQLRMMVSQQAAEEMCVQPIEIFESVADAKARLYIEKEVRISKRAREIEQLR
ncbi:MAG: hypothetical protein WBF35_03915, partial [Candidatus Acidiferrales bacterium]